MSFDMNPSHHRNVDIALLLKTHEAHSEHGSAQSENFGYFDSRIARLQTSGASSLSSRTSAHHECRPTRHPYAVRLSATRETELMSEELIDR